jgi:hypothetical protein
MITGKDKRYFDREFKYEAIQLMNEGKRSVQGARDGGVKRIAGPLRAVVMLTFGW